MELLPTAGDLTENGITAFFTQIPIIPGDLTIICRADQKFRFRIQKLVIQKRPPGMCRFTADDSPLHLQSCRVCHLPGTEGVLICVGGLFLPPYVAFLHTMLYKDSL